MRFPFASWCILHGVSAGLAAPASAQVDVLYSTNFDHLHDWTVVPGCIGAPWVWAADATPASHPGGPYRNAPASLNFNDGTDIGGGEYPGGMDGPHTCGTTTSPVIDLSLAAGAPRLEFWASWHCEDGCEYDLVSLRVLPAGGGPALFEVPCMNPSTPTPWMPFTFALDRAWGLVRIEFGFDTIDPFFNTYTGPFIDDLAVVHDVPPSTIVCSGDGSGTPCPCGNAGGPDEGCANSTGNGARLVAGGSASVGAGDLVLAASHLRPNQFGTYLQGNASLNGGDGIVFGDGLRCAGGSLVRLQQVLSDANGLSATSIDVALRGGVSPGDTRTYQLWYRDPAISPCGSNFNLSNGLELAWVP